MIQQILSRLSAEDVAHMILSNTRALIVLDTSTDVAPGGCFNDFVKACPQLWRRSAVSKHGTCLCFPCRCLQCQKEAKAIAQVWMKDLINTNLLWHLTNLGILPSWKPDPKWRQLLEQIPHCRVLHNKKKTRQKTLSWSFRSIFRIELWFLIRSQWRNLNWCHMRPFGRIFCKCRRCYTSVDRPRRRCVTNTSTMTC